MRSDRVEQNPTFSFIFHEKIKNKFQLKNYMDTGNLVARLVIELAAIFDPEEGNEIKNANTDFNYVSCETRQNTLLIHLVNLHGEINYIKLAGIYNDIDKAFDAHYTVTNMTNPQPAYADKKFFTLCLNTETFIKYLDLKKYPATYIKKNPDRIGLYRRYDNDNDHPPLHRILNAYPLHHLEIEIRKRIDENKNCFSRNTLNVESVFSSWKNEIQKNLLIENILLLPLYLRENYELFPKELLFQFYYLVFKHEPSAYFGKNMLLHADKFSQKEKEDELFGFVKNASRDTLSPDICVFSNNRIIIKYEGTIPDYKEISDQFEIYFDDKNKFQIEKSDNEYKSTRASCTYLNIYVHFKEKHLKEFKATLENIMNANNAHMTAFDMD